MGDNLGNNLGMIRNKPSYSGLNNLRGPTALLMLLLGVAIPGNAALTMTYEQAQEFFGGRPAKVVYCDFKTPAKIMFIDFSKSPLQAKLIRSDAARNNMKMSPDGNWLVYYTGDALTGQSYITKVEENSKVKISLGQGINPNWWTHPKTGKEFILLQRGNTVGGSNGIYMQELGADKKPVGAAVRLLNEPMANGGRSPDGQFLGNNDEEHEQCWHGHGFYDISPADAVSNAEIKYWVYVSAPGWYAGGKEQAAYCNGAISPAPVGHKFHRALVHMGSAHYRIFIRRPENYQSMPKVKNNDSGVPCNDLLSWDSTEPMLTIDPPKSLGISGSNDARWGFSDWSTHPDFIAGTGGSGSSSRLNPNGYFVNLAKKKGDAGFAARFATGEVAEPNLWVSQGASTLIHQGDIGGNGQGSFSILKTGRNGFLAKLNTQGIHTVRVVDVQGRNLFFREGNGMEEYSFDLNGLSGGLYFFQVDADGKRYSQELVTSFIN